MNASNYQIRPFESLDYPEEARTLTLLDPPFPTSARELERRESALRVPPFLLHKVVAEDRRSMIPIGFGSLRSTPGTFDPKSVRSHIAVRPDHQGKGVGFALASKLEADALSLGVKRFWATIDADEPRALKFFRARAFVEKRRRQISRLELSRGVPESAAYAGGGSSAIRFLTAADLPLEDETIVRRLYELTQASIVDAPHVGESTTYPIDLFVSTELRGPNFIPEAYFIAADGDQFVGVSVLRRVEGVPTTLHQTYTGVLRAYRGQGIAFELKRRAVEYASRSGFKFIDTANDSENAAILRLNKRLGFRVEQRLIVGEKLLS